MHSISEEGWNDSETKVYADPVYGKPVYCKQVDSRAAKSHP